MSLNRRDFIKANAVAAAAATAGMAIPTTVLSAEQAGAKNAVRWDKAACRFCGTGCSVLVGVQNDKVVATQGDPDAPVNRGLNCIKGYFLSKIMYGADRCTDPAAAQEERRVRQGRRVHSGELGRGAST